MRDPPAFLTTKQFAMTKQQLDTAINACIGQNGSQNQAFTINYNNGKFIRYILAATAQVLPGVPSIAAPQYFDQANDLLNFLNAINVPANGYRLFLPDVPRVLLTKYIRRVARILANGNPGGPVFPA